jgi:hypothetical protein
MNYNILLTGKVSNSSNRLFYVQVKGDVYYSFINMDNGDDYKDKDYTHLVITRTLPGEVAYKLIYRFETKSDLYSHVLTNNKFPISLLLEEMDISYKIISNEDLGIYDGMELNTIRDKLGVQSYKDWGELVHLMVIDYLF